MRVTATPDSPITVDVEDRVAVVTMDRPEARNALNRALRSALPVTLGRLDADVEIDVIVLTGRDPAFCAGLDLKELGSGAHQPGSPPSPGPSDGSGVEPTPMRPFPPMVTPLIGAINGAAITGGFELALNCDFLIASEHAVFADTHARVGVMPGWGLTVLLASAIGVRRARELSLTGRFLSADDARELGLVNHVVPHGDLLATARETALEIVGVPHDGVSQMLATYAEIDDERNAAGWQIEASNAREFRDREGFDPATVEARREGIVARGRGQLGH